MSALALVFAVAVLSVAEGGAGCCRFERVFLQAPDRADSAVLHRPEEMLVVKLAWAVTPARLAIDTARSWFRDGEWSPELATTSSSGASLWYSTRPSGPIYCSGVLPHDHRSDSIHETSRDNQFL